MTSKQVIFCKNSSATGAKWKNWGFTLQTSSAALLPWVDLHPFLCWMTLLHFLGVTAGKSIKFCHYKLLEFSPCPHTVCFFTTESNSWQVHLSPFRSLRCEADTSVLLAFHPFSSCLEKTHGNKFLWTFLFDWRWWKIL